jgi:hypothetical protein
MDCYRAIVSALIGLALLWPTPAQAAPNKAGVAFDKTYSGHTLDQYALRSVGASWAYDYRANATTQGDVEYIQSLYVLNPASAPGAATIAQARPGSTWLLGNEPDHAGQSAQTPAQYAAAYKAIYRAIKAADPTAKVYAGGISTVSPLRLAWLDAMLAAYGEPFELDGWHIHPYILPEACGWGVGLPVGIPPTVAQGRGCEYGNRHGDPTALIEQVKQFRQWSIAKGLRRPVIVSEFGILLTPAHGYDQAKIMAFMSKTVRWLNNCRYVSRYAWFSANLTSMPGALMDPATKQPNALGLHYRRITGKVRTKAAGAGTERVFLPVVGR